MVYTVQNGYWVWAILNSFMNSMNTRKCLHWLIPFYDTVRPGNNTVRRRSTESSVTIPYERTFRNQADRPGTQGSAEAAEFDFCGCGWPNHMLIAKGTPKGYPVVLFAMLTNWNDDRVSLIFSFCIYFLILLN